MNRMIRASEIMALPVVTIDGGEDVAEVKDVVYGSEEGRLLGLTLNKRGFMSGRMKAVLPASSVSAIGPDAVMISDVDALVARSDAPDEVAKPDGDRDVIGNEVITEGGTKLGTVSDLVMWLGGDGEVVGYQLARPDRDVTWFIPRPAQLALSGEALLVPDQVEQYVSDDFSGFGAAVERYRSEHGDEGHGDQQHGDEGGGS